MSIQAESNIPMSKDQNSFIQGIKDCVPTLLGYMSIGFAFGIVGVSSGLSIFEIALMSILVYAGSAQFIICALLVVNTPASAIILTTFIVNLRHFLLSLTIAPYLTRYSISKNIGFGALLTDETFGVAANRIAEQGSLSGKWMNGLNLTAYLCWIAACTLGGISGQWIADPEALGLDFALVAMFAALLVLQLNSTERSKLKHRLSLVLYMVICMIVLSYFVPSHVAVLLSTVIVATIGVVTER
ncbi:MULTISPECIES: AzlC family ABC transporter permease [unclassified Paenibacillus]|uniref:AzlC family ABC transporter permease n=1 Tax=Paenibacillus provencensis TaxID=441151 RepID=A0ABW3PXG1_9BACL|nr:MULTISPECIES: AzlC family ABC transporter permease [unclassified Paenibacillus]MCM3129046.1 AzlC family ABC transporter permease [Paenibacillus sp. MER 78]SFS51031.1 4-azaleucine resistance probable transporter AzlC [Paenibacillus sp. 453mf]